MGPGLLRVRRVGRCGGRVRARCPPPPAPCHPTPAGPRGGSPSPTVTCTGVQHCARSAFSLAHQCWALGGAAAGRCLCGGRPRRRVWRGSRARLGATRRCYGAAAAAQVRALAVCGFLFLSACILVFMCRLRSTALLLAWLACICLPVANQPNQRGSHQLLAPNPPPSPPPHRPANCAPCWIGGAAVLAPSPTAVQLLAPLTPAAQPPCGDSVR